MGILDKILAGPLDVAAKYFTRRMEIKAEDRQQERAIKKALTERQIDLISQGLAADMQWESLMADQARSSYKDEWVLFLLSVPAIGVFIPRIQEHIMVGFSYLEKCPKWYQLLLVTVFLATYGIRYWRRSQFDTEVSPSTPSPKNTGVTNS